MGGLKIRMAWRNLWRRSRRTWLTAAAMTFSNVLLVFAIGLQYGMYDLMIENGLQMTTGHIQVQAEGYLDQPRMHRVVENADVLVEALSVQPGVTAVGSRGEAFALASSEDRSYGIQISGVDPRREPRISSLPGLITRGSYLSGVPDEIVLGAVLAKNLKVDIGDEVTLLGSGRDGSFAAAIVRVVGILDTGIADVDRYIAQMPLEGFRQTFAMGDSSHRIVVRLTDTNAVPAVMPRIEKQIADSDGIVAHDWDRLEPGLRQMIKADMFSAWVSYIVLIVLVAFSVLNTQLMSVMERTHEFGVVLALGVRPGRLARLVLLETALLGLIGTLGGILIGALLNGWLSVRGFSYPGMDEMAARFNLPDRMYPEVSPGPLLIGPAIVFFASMLAAVYPALRLLRLQPVEAMRAVG